MTNFDPNNRGEVPEKDLLSKAKMIRKSFQAKTTKHTLPSKDHINQPPTKR